MYGYDFQNINGRSHGNTLRILLSILNEPCKDTHSQDSCGKDSSKKALMELGLEEGPDCECLFVHRRQNILFGLRVWHQNGRKEAEFSSRVEEIDEGRWRYGANIISWSRLLMMHSAGMQTTRENNSTIQQWCLNPIILLGQPRKFQDGTNIAQKLQRGLTTWKDTLENAWNGIANWRTKRRSSYTKFLIFVWTIIKSKKKNSKIKVNCQKFALQTVLKCLYLARIGRPDILWSLNKLARSVTKWTQSMQQTIGTINFLHSFHEWLPPVLSCGQCGSTLSIAVISRCRLCRRSWRLKINIRRVFLHSWKSNMCTNQLDVQEANVSVAQLYWYWVRTHIVGCWFAFGRFTCAWLLGVGHRSAGNDPKMTQRTSTPTQSCTRETSVKTQITPKIEQVLDQNVDLSNIDQVISNAHLSEKESQLYIFEDNESVIKMIIKGRSPTMRHVSPHPPSCPGLVTWQKQPGTPKSKSSMSNPKTNSQAFQQKAVSRVTSGTKLLRLFNIVSDTTFSCSHFCSQSFLFRRKVNLQCRKDLTKALLLVRQWWKRKHVVSFRDNAYLLDKIIQVTPEARMSTRHCSCVETWGVKKWEDSGWYSRSRMPRESESTREESFRTKINSDTTRASRKYRSTVRRCIFLYWTRFLASSMQGSVACGPELRKEFGIMQKFWIWEHQRFVRNYENDDWWKFRK